MQVCLQSSTSLVFEVLPEEVLCKDYNVNDAARAKSEKILSLRKGLEFKIPHTLIVTKGPDSLDSDSVTEKIRRDIILYTQNNSKIMSLCFA